MTSKLLTIALLVAATAVGCKPKADKKDEVAPAAPPPQAAAPAPPPAQPTVVNAGAFSIPKTTFVRGEDIPVTYNQDMTAPPGQKHWITLAKPGDVESAWGVWHYVPQSAKTDVVKPPTAGEWEIRLHDVYPKWASRVIARQRITVQ